jgi:Domain of unknown function (DUF892)
MQKALKLASAPALREGIEMHIEQTQVQIERVEQAMDKLESRRDICWRRSHRDFQARQSRSVQPLSASIGCAGMARPDGNDYLD